MCEMLQFTGCVLSKAATVTAAKSCIPPPDWTALGSALRQEGGFGDFHHTSLTPCVLIPSELMRNMSTLHIHQTSSPYIKPQARKINADLSYKSSSPF